MPDPETARSRPTTRWALLAAAAAAIAAVLVIAVVTRAPSAPPPTTTAEWSVAKEAWVLPPLSGSQPVRLSQFRGHPTVVTFFASWCTACQAELPVFRDAAQRTASRVTFVGVDSLETSDGRAMAKQYGIDSWPLALDVDGSAASGLHDAVGAVGMPATVFYDSAGSILFVQQGEMTKATLDAQLQRLYGVS